MNKLNVVILLLCLTFSVQQLSAQSETLDKIIAIVGDKIILRSEIDAAFDDYRRENPSIPDSFK